MIYLNRTPFYLIKTDSKLQKSIDSLLSKKLNWIYKVKLKSFSIKRDEVLPFCDFVLTKEQIRSLYPIAITKGFQF